ncbi:MAG: YceI family protein [Ectothiorhodospiraceae bacterium]|nr:YceI family protein [Ectothiorhodospiraceae bacterium]
MMRRAPGRRLAAVVIAGTALVAAVARAQAPAPPPWSVDTERSTVGFAVELFGGAVRGSFGRFEATIRLDLERPAAGSIVASVDTASVSTRNSERDQALVGPDWLATGTYPRAEFSSREIRRVDGGLVAEGTLTLVGRSVPIAVPLVVRAEGDRRVLDATITLDRGSFGIGRGEWADTAVLGDAVEVSVHVEATQPSQR